MVPRQSTEMYSDATPPRVTRSSSTEETRALKNKPKSSKLRQQKLPAWQPILTSCTAIPVVFAIGIVFIPIGIVLLLSAESVQEWSIEYDKICANKKICTIDVPIKEAFKGDVYFYYGLENYFQNHRRYVKSRSDDQLSGRDLMRVADCFPLDGEDTPKGRMPYAPCGAIANSMFNDTFKLVNSNKDEVSMTTKGVVWEVDRTTRYKNPSIPHGKDLCAAFEGTIKPRNWKKSPCELSTDPENNGFLNTDFIVWMRTAALPSFRKLYRLLDRKSKNYTDGLPTGKYSLVIENNYDVSKFNGKKSFIISTTSWTGGRNTFLGIAYIVIGCICVLLGAIFTVIHVKFGYSRAEMVNITTNTR